MRRLRHQAWKILDTTESKTSSHSDTAQHCTTTIVRTSPLRQYHQNTVFLTQTNLLVLFELLASHRVQCMAFSNFISIWFDTINQPIVVDATPDGTAWCWEPQVHPGMRLVDGITEQVHGITCSNSGTSKFIKASPSATLSQLPPLERRIQDAMAHPCSSVRFM